MSAQLRNVRTPHDLKLALIIHEGRANLARIRKESAREGLVWLPLPHGNSAFHFEAEDVAAVVASWPSPRRVDTWGRDLVRAAVEA